MSQEASVAYCNQMRVQIKLVAELVAEARKYKWDNGEAIANVTLAFRHLEDASMRLGKAKQALDGGVSVYDASTTVLK